MSEAEMTLPELPAKFIKYEQKLRSCIDFLKKGLDNNEKAHVLGKARYEFNLYLSFNRHHTVQVTPDDALWHAVCSITNDRAIAQKAINACCLSHMILKKCIGPYRALKNRFLHVTA